MDPLQFDSFGRIASTHYLFLPILLPAKAPRWVPFFPLLLCATHLGSITRTDIFLVGLVPVVFFPNILQ